MCYCRLVLGAAILGTWFVGPSDEVGAQSQRKIVILAGSLDRGHPPGTHEYEKSGRLIKHNLDAAPIASLAVELHLGGWPDDPRTLDDADAIVVISNGSDRRREDHPLFVENRLETIGRQMRRGCGLVLIHWSTFWPNDAADEALEWVGGYFDYQSGPPPQRWFSKIQTASTQVRPVKSHSIARGMLPFDLRDEFYYQIRFREPDSRLRPIAMVRLPNETVDHIVAWAVERGDGGRGFGFTGGHFFENWKSDHFRRLLLNAIVWTAKIDVPDSGIAGRYPTETELARVVVGRPIRTVVVTGHQHPAHTWRETTGALVDVLAADARFDVRVVEDPEFLADPQLHRAQLVVMNYCNWQRPGLGEEAKRNFVKYLSGGGGLAIIHFANGAFHFSLPNTPPSDWPEWRTRICRRVWDHTPGKSGHDNYGPFTVAIAPTGHAITAGLDSFATTDELYFRQQGDEPIQVLAFARSKITGRDEPMAFVHQYGNGRVFQTVLGHDAAAIRNRATAELIRRGSAWAAGRSPTAKSGALPPAATTNERGNGAVRVPAAPAASSGSYQLADADLKLIRLDSSPNESFLAVRADACGRLFVGGREALFVFEPTAAGRYEPRKLLYRFPPDSWLTNIEIRGDDLYVATAAAIYRISGARVRRHGLTPQRIVSGPPLDLHVTFHGLAWGPQGRLYFNCGDPLLNHGDFANRPDHWGHWTFHVQPQGTRVPYTGVGGFFRVNADGSQFEVVAGGTRGTDGLVFDRDWSLFSNDNDHESLPNEYSPARLLHVAPQAHFFWPRGWIASKSPERSDLLETIYTGLGRDVPVGMAYYDEPLLPERFRNNLLLARWGERRVDRLEIERRGASFAARSVAVLMGSGAARPVGLAVGRGGRIFVTISYMQANEHSPKYPSDLVMITRADDSPTHPFDSYDPPSADTKRLWSELSQSSWERRKEAHIELLRRGGEVLDEAVDRLKAIDPADAACVHLPWLAGAAQSASAKELLVQLTRHADARLRLQAIRVLAEFPQLKASPEVFLRALRDRDPHIQHAGIVGLFSLGAVPDPLLSGPARSQDSYLRQASAFLVARYASKSLLEQLCGDADPALRLAGVLAVGFRLTVPPPTAPIPNELALRYDHGNAFFQIQYADRKVDLHKLGRLGSFTTADWWRLAKVKNAEARTLFELLMRSLGDTDRRVRLQAAYFLWLLGDPAGDSMAQKVRHETKLESLAQSPKRVIDRAWIIGPFDDGPAGLETKHPPELGAVDLAARYPSTKHFLEWKDVKANVRFELAGHVGATGRSSFFLMFRLDSMTAAPALLDVETAGSVRLYHNGRPVFGRQPPVVDLEPGSNDLLVRVATDAEAASVTLGYRTDKLVEPSRLERVDQTALAARLRESAGLDSTAIPQEFLAVDWSAEARRGDPNRGRKLFGRDALGCVKCHAIAAGQSGQGAPSLTAAGKRFTVAHLVESILAPSRQVAPLFRATLIATRDGAVWTGLLIEEDRDHVVLLLSDATRKTIARADIEERRLQEISPMPTGLVKTPDELRDVLAYLLSDDPLPP